MNRSSLRIFPLLAVLALLVSACTIYVRPGTVSDVDVDLSDVIVDFRPTRGEGSTYYVGEEIEFYIDTTQSGYVTLSAIDPDGSVYVFSRNIPVGPGRTVLPLPSQRVAFSAAPPRGFHRVRAHFTPQRTDETVTFRGRYGDGEWTSAITLEIRAYPVRDVEETYLYIR
jgi:hypothetical protein